MPNRDGIPTAQEALVEIERMLEDPSLPEDERQRLLRTKDAIVNRPLAGGQVDRGSGVVVRDEEETRPADELVREIRALLASDALTPEDRDRLARLLKTFEPMGSKPVRGRRLTIRHKFLPPKPGSA